MKKASWKFLIYLLGNAVTAFAVAVFVLPYGFIIGGATGIGKVIGSMSGLSVSNGIWIANIGLFLAAWIFLGTHYAATIVIGTFTFPIFLELFEKMTYFQNMTEDPLIACIFAGLLMGAGTGLVLRYDGSTGGSDVIPLILNKKMGIPIAPMMYTVDVIILVCQGFMSEKNEILLGILLTLLISMVLNKVLLMGQGEVQLLIFSKKDQEICDALINQADVGATRLHSTTGYLGENREVILCITTKQNMNRIKNISLEIDPMAFVVISNIREVRGRGFSMSRTKGITANEIE